MEEITNKLFQVCIFVNNSQGHIHVKITGKDSAYTKIYEEAKKTLDMMEKVGYKGTIEEVLL